MLTVQLFCICTVFLSFWVLRRTDRRWGRGTPGPAVVRRRVPALTRFLWDPCENRSQEFLAIAMATALTLRLLFPGDPFTGILIRHQAVGSIMVPSTVSIRQWLASSDSS
jgi:hypothetical protein